MSFPWLPKAQAIRGEWNCSLFHTSITTYFNHPVIHCPCDVYLTNTFPTPLNHSSLFSLCTNSVKSALRSYNKYMQTLTHMKFDHTLPHAIVRTRNEAMTDVKRANIITMTTKYKQGFHKQSLTCNFEIVNTVCVSLHCLIAVVN